MHSDAGPRFPTDCTLCVFVKRDGPFDVYLCPAGSLITGLVWRYGAGPLYTTMPEQVRLMREQPR